MSSAITNIFRRILPPFFPPAPTPKSMAQNPYRPPNPDDFTRMTASGVSDSSTTGPARLSAPPPAQAPGSPHSSGWTLGTGEFLKALLMDRFKLVLFNPAAVLARIQVLEILLERLTALSLPMDHLTAEARVIFENIHKGQQALSGGQPHEVADHAYDAALEGLVAGTTLENYDKKKWHLLTPDQRAELLFFDDHYYRQQPEKAVLEKNFRQFHAMRRLHRAQEALEEGHLQEAVLQVTKVTWEIRRIVALSLVSDLDTLRSEAEKISGTTGVSHRSAFLGLIHKLILPSNPACRRVEEVFLPVMAVPLMTTDLLSPVRENHYEPRVIQNCHSTEDLLRAIQEQPANLTVVLSPDASIDWKRILREGIGLPPPEARGYIRMPDKDSLISLEIKDAQGNTWLQCDERGRLVRAPQRSEVETGVYHKDSTFVDCVLVGGGPASISAATTALVAGRGSHVIIERFTPFRTIREVWPGSKYADASYGAGKDELPAASQDSADRFKEQVSPALIGMEDSGLAPFLSRMWSIIKGFQLNIRDHESATSIKQEEETGLWRVETDKGTYRTPHVVMAIGRYAKPKLTEWEKKDMPTWMKERIVRFSLEKIHNSRVLVIGGGNSAADYVTELTDRGRGTKENSVALSYRQLAFNVPDTMLAHNGDQLIDWALKNEIQFYLNSNIHSVEPFEETLPDGATRMAIKVTFKEADPKEIIVDHIAPATGWELDVPFLRSIGVNFPNGKKDPDYDPETGKVFTIDEHGERKVLKGFYVSGDVASQKNIPAAFIAGHRTMQFILS